MEQHLHLSTMATSATRPQEDNKRDVGGQSKLMRWAASVIPTLIFLVAFGWVVSWVTVQPKTFVYKVEDGTISNINVDPDNSVSADFNFSMSFYNPSPDDSFNYSNMQASVSSGNRTLDIRNIDDFVLQKNKTQLLSVNLSSQSITQLPLKTGYYSYSMPVDLILITVILTERSDFLSLQIQIKCTDAGEILIWTDDTSTEWNNSGTVFPATCTLQL